MSEYPALSVVMVYCYYAGCSILCNGRTLLRLRCGTLQKAQIFRFLKNVFSVVCIPYTGCETWSLLLREERMLRVFENWMLRRIFGPKTHEETGKWRKVRNEELSDL